MTTRVFLVCLVAAPLLGGCGGGGNKTPRSQLSAKLSGSMEVPQGASGGSGSATVKLDIKTGKACWKLTVDGIDTPLSAHIHRGAEGQAGPVVIPLGDTFAMSGCVLVPKRTLEAVLADPSAYYVNVHTKKYLNGAVRGQLRSG